MKNINEIISALPIEDRERVSARAEQLIGQEMALQHLRKARCLTQASMANMLGIGQESVSKLESRSDLLLSTLRSYVEAMGGSLCLVAKFPDGIATLSAFGQVEDSSSDKPSERRAISRAVKGRKNVVLAHAND